MNVEREKHVRTYIMRSFETIYNSQFLQVKNDI